MNLVLAILLVVACVGFVFVAAQKRKAETELKRSAGERAALQQKNADLERENQLLRKYQKVIDAEAQAQEIVRQAESSAADVINRARAQAETLLAEAKGVQARIPGELASAAAKGERIVEEAKKRAEEMVQQAESSAADVVSRARAQAETLLAEVRRAQARIPGELASAAAESERIVKEAKKRAEEIAGEAYKAVEEADRYRTTVQALKNVLEGYGDRYLVPTYSLLDELADEFGFAEAGQRLKSARERTRQMIKARLAAQCDYVEEIRRNTAIDFVTDAFNGKVDTILAEVREDNYGTLAQKIRDAATLVNHNGRAFKEARITPAYRDARLEELRWAVVAYELKEKEREEQRAIKERIREEEKAQKEFERAMKEAAKEEEYLRKAMEKAKQEVAKATDAQKSKYEEQLRQLAEKLQEAEEKNKRALSMAQQTRSGNVYIISNEGSFGQQVFKIGLTRRLDPEDRIRELGDASVPFQFDVHAMIKSDDAPSLERELHQHFARMQMNKVNPRKEFFRVDLQEIRQEVERLGYHAAWTMTAACREYKESLAIEQALKDGRLQEGEWISRQEREHDAGAKAEVA